ncbi:unnamed protein product [Arabidopsis thaliana]|uniref:(thale cress) hypothetical protein n=1 Tax=Arabidopsis thaliana TaxID=3702 RepID=A0A7G2F7L5_ARATH|nr:unnamed protein product [Arabidopsis thaliana]
MGRDIARKEGLDNEKAGSLAPSTSSRNIGKRYIKNKSHRIFEFA